MKNNVKTIINILLAAFILVLAGCSDGLTQKSVARQTVEISGSIGSDEAPRSASYSSNGIAFSVSATNGTDTIAATVMGKSFIIYLPLYADGGGKTTELNNWTFTAQGKNSAGQVVFSGEKLIRNPGNQAHFTISVGPIATTGNGSINLLVIDETKTISKAKVKFYQNDLTTQNTNPASLEDASFTDGVCSIKGSNIPAGNYNAQISFYVTNDSGEALVYSCMEVITVAPGLETNSWFGKNSTYLKNNLGSYDFVITQEILDGFKR